MKKATFALLLIFGLTAMVSAEELPTSEGGGSGDWRQSRFQKSLDSGIEYARSSAQGKVRSCGLWCQREAVDDFQR